MEAVSYAREYETLCQYAGDAGRNEALFGDSMARVQEVVPPFLVGPRFPEVYFEFPLAGRPLLDVSVLYPRVVPGMRVDSPVAGDCGDVFDFVAQAQRRCRVVSFGFELDTGSNHLSRAGMYFQPRHVTELAASFCRLIGERGRAAHYEDLARRMPPDWPLAYMGLFPGRPDSPMRVGGYLTSKERGACADDPTRISVVFERAGFSSFTGEMLRQVAELMRVAPKGMDFQFDVCSDGMLGDSFALEVSIVDKTIDAARDSLTDGPASRVMALLRAWGLSDGRDELVRGSVMQCRVPLLGDDGKPWERLLEYRLRWVKVRWSDGRPVIAKCYCRPWAGLVPRPKIDA